MMISFRFCLVSSAALFIAACETTPQPAPPPAAVAPAAPASPAAPTFMLNDILLARPAALDAMFGAPSLTRKEGTGEYRRYRLSQCVLIVILYPDDTGKPRAEHVDVTALSSGQEKPDLNACLAAG